MADDMLVHSSGLSSLPASPAGTWTAMPEEQEAGRRRRRREGEEGRRRETMREEEGGEKGVAGRVWGQGGVLQGTH